MHERYNNAWVSLDATMPIHGTIFENAATLKMTQFNTVTSDGQLKS